MNLRRTKLRLGKSIEKPCIVFVSSLSQRKCGIAKFTRDLTHSAVKLFGKQVNFKRVAILGTQEKKNTPAKGFIYKIERDLAEDYRDCARFLNADENVKLVSIQHEFGIFGGEMGSHLLKFLAEIKKPIFVTFHTVIPRPNKKTLSLVKKIEQKAKEIVVMTERSKKYLLRDYHLSAEKINLIPHGIPSFDYENSNDKIKKRLGLEDKTLLLTQGFLSRNKGIEYVLDSLPEVVKKYPQTLYLMVGSTHPNVKLQEGESYRNFLLKKIKDLSLQKNVKLVNKYITTHDLIEYLKACDIYISTSIDPNQAVSGTFAYALGSGRPVISTAFSHSREALREGMGILVRPRDPKSYEEALMTLIGNEKLRKSMGMSCYFKTRNMTWQNVALSYGRVFSKYVPKVEESLILPPVVLTHLFRMTDDFGLLQFAKLTTPLKKSGYTVDDNARALITAGMYYKKHQNKEVLNYLKIYLDFLKYAFYKPTGNFRNYVNFDRSFNQKRNERESHEDPTSRALYALARTTATLELPQGIRQEAWKIFMASFRKCPKFTYNKAIAHYLKALYFAMLTGKNLQKIKKETICYADILSSRCEKYSSGDWVWFEDVLTYSNGILPEALFMAYQATGQKKYWRIASETTEFLIRHSFEKGFCVPIGQKYWFRKGRQRSYHDQQPEETTSLVQMLKTAYGVTREARYKRLMIAAYNWFLGNNTLGQIVCDFKTGGCYDGIGEKEVNLNQGAESTLSYLIARLIVSKR